MIEFEKYAGLGRGINASICRMTDRDVLNEGVCARFEDFQVKYPTTPGKGHDYAIFSILDELIGHTGVLANQAACYRAGYQIMIDAEGGHRLRREVIRQIKQDIFKKK